MTADCAGLKYKVERNSNMRGALHVTDWRLAMASRSLAPSPATRHCGRSHSTWVTNCTEQLSPLL